MKVFHAAMLLSSSSTIAIVVLAECALIGIIGVSADRK